MEWGRSTHTQSGRIVKATRKKNTVFQLLIIALHCRQVPDIQLKSAYHILFKRTFGVFSNMPWHCLILQLSSPARAAQWWDPDHTKTLAQEWLLWVGSALTNLSTQHTDQTPLQQRNTCCMWYYGNKISSFAHTANAPFKGTTKLFL